MSNECLVRCLAGDFYGSAAAEPAKGGRGGGKKGGEGAASPDSPIIQRMQCSSRW